jgi:hypothetical protein
MAVTSNTTLGNFQFALQSALSAYTDEMYTNSKKLVGTDIIGTNADIDPTTETFIGQARFFKPYSSQVVNVASVTDATDGSKQSYTSDFLTYVKTVRTHGAQEINVQRVVSQMDGLAKIARDFAEVKAQDEDDAIVSVLKGVAAHEAGVGAGFADFGMDYSSANTTNGFYVDVNAAGAFGAGAGTNRGLIMDADPASTGYGAILGENLFKALSLGFADYEPPFMYMITSPEMMTQLRIANLIDQTTVTEGNLEFNTIFSGKFRLINTRTNMGNNSAASDVTTESVKTTFLVKPGAIEMATLSVPTPTELYRDANKYQGSGATDIFYRWGYVMHPMGYSWAGASNAFATNAALSTAASYERKFDMLNLGVLPIFHA